MNSIFRHDSPIIKFLTKIGDVVCLSALWLMFSIPIFTIGASTVALYTVAFKNIRNGEGYIWKSFWNSFKGEFKRATIVWLIGFAVMALLTADLFMFRGLKLAERPMGNLYWVAFAIWWVALTWMVYLAAYTARINGSVRETFKNGYLLMILHPIRTLGVLITLIGGFAIVLMVPFMALVVPAVVMMICSFPLEKTFLRHQPSNDEDDEEDTDGYDETEESFDYE